MKRRFPVITKSDKKLPFYLIDAACDWNQEHVILKNGYFYQWVQCVKGEGAIAHIAAALELDDDKTSETVKWEMTQVLNWLKLTYTEDNDSPWLIT